MPVLTPADPVYRHVARLLCALGGGDVASAQDLEDAAAIDALWPGTGDQVKAAREFHARAARWAVTGGGARSLIIAPVSYPCRPDPHLAALQAAPATRVVLADGDEEVALVARAVWGADPRVAVAAERASDPAALMALPEVASLPGAACLMLPFIASMAPGGAVAGMLREYGELLPAGSVVIVSLWVPDGGPAGEEFLASWRDLVGPAYACTAGDVAGWLEGAGMEILGAGVQDVRVRAGTEWQEAAFRRRSPGRFVEAGARVR